MKFIVSTLALKNILTDACAFVSDKGSSLNQAVILRLTDNKLEVLTKSAISTPYRQIAFKGIENVSGMEDGIVAANASKLNLLVSNFNLKEEIQVSTTKDYIKLNQNSCDFKLKKTDLSEETEKELLEFFDKFDTEAEFITINEFPTFIKKVAVATDKNAHMTALRSVCMDYTNEKLHFVATDGKRISNMAIQLKGKGSYIIPVEVAKLMANKDVNQLWINNNSILFKKGNRYYWSSIYTETYPAWRNVLAPKIDSEKITVKKSDILDALNRANIVADKAIRRVFLTVEDNKMTLTSSSLDGSFTETIDCENTKPTTISIKNDYLYDAINASDSDEIVIHFGEDNRPILITDDDPRYRALIAPMNKN